MVASFLKGLEDSVANPDEAYELSKKHVPNLAEVDETVQKEVLARSIALWEADHLGFSEAASLVEGAVVGCIESEETPVELQGNLGTREVGDAVCRRIRELGG